MVKDRRSKDADWVQLQPRPGSSAVLYLEVQQCGMYTVAEAMLSVTWHNRETLVGLCHVADSMASATLYTPYHSRTQELKN
jgi:hypothetical protein